MKSISSRQIITILTTIITITVNALASILPLNGQDTGQISDRFNILFVPDGYVFAIWGIIYLGLLFYTIYQALPTQRDNRTLNAIAPLYWLGSLANSIWIFLWHYEFFLITPIAMITLLVSLILIYTHISKSRAGFNTAQKGFVLLPFSIYLGWISVATVANITQVLFYINWGGWGISAEAWAVIMLGVATLLGVLMHWREKDIAYGLVLIWAFIGIAVKQADFAFVATTAWVTAAILMLSTISLPILKKSSS
jgi:hypothetical protein